MKQYALFFLFILAACPALAAPVSSSAPVSAPIVAVSIAPQAWLVDQIGGALIQTVTLIPAGADPHMYEPRPSQVTTLSRAMLYLSLGMEFEKAWLPRLTSTNPAMRVEAMDKGVEKIAMLSHGHQDENRILGDGRSHGKYDDHEKTKAEDRQWTDRNGPPDPHIWTEPANMLIMAKNTFEALQRLDPAHSETYLKNYFTVRRKIEKLEIELMKLFAAKQGANRAFMVFHPSWGYFARAHALTQVPIEIGGHEPSPKELAAVITKARKMNIKAIFVQPQMSAKAARVVADEIGAKLIEADPLAYDWAKNLRSVAHAFHSALR